MATNFGNIRHVTIAEAAAQLETTIPRVLMLLRKKLLSGRQLEGEWYVESDSIACARTHGMDMKAAGGCASSCSSSCGCK